jgi:uncharacterized protein (DUF983 family)
MAGEVLEARELAVTAAGDARSRSWAIAHLRCPRCREGRIFRSLWGMNETCPACGLRFSRETGYFLGSMYFSYAIGIPLILIFTFAAYLAFPGWRLYQQCLLGWLLFLPLAPWVYRYSRAMWIHFDRYFDPD